MNRYITIVSFVLGALAVLWMGASFRGSDALALAVIIAIGAVYCIGFMEMRQYRRATGTLSGSLARLGGHDLQDESGLNAWLAGLDPDLRHPVRQRIEGLRVALPAPALTPYLVGLLVMLGLLGTFAGMVETLGGAVLALQGSAELEAIRSGLAAPIEGLGLAFGTSVAGIAASATLGLASALARRDRLQAAGDLDAAIAGPLAAFSMQHSRRESYRALREQAGALPELASRLERLSENLEGMGTSLGEQLLANQSAFQAASREEFATLAASLEGALQASASEGGRLAGEQIRPLIGTALDSVSEAARQTQATLSTAAQDQVAALTARLDETASRFGESLETTARAAGESQAQMAGAWEQRVSDLSQRLGDAASGVGAAIEQAATASGDAQEKAAAAWDQRVADLSRQLGDTAEQISLKVESAAQRAERSGETLTAGMQNALTGFNEGLTGTSTALQEGFANTSGAWVAQQEAWLQSHAEAMEALSSSLREELGALREAEAERSGAAVERLAALETAASARLGALEGVAADHLSQLGRSLEEPMAQLIDTASETPRAAAEVIGELRREISQGIERDNEMLAERRRVMGELDELSGTLAQAASEQRDAVRELIDSAGASLAEAAGQFGGRVDDGLAGLSGSALQVAGSAAEIASLGESFAGAVDLLKASNEQLMESLARVEESLDQSARRGEEQMGYYVAQAREIIDYSLAAQREIVEELRGLGQQEELFPTGTD